ncbi:MAG: Asp-tRNA(Asn)/Glu-tRNA(Gln) amidotransferase subunit GatC [Candidatus Shapirobacteria bacterium]
MDVKKVARLANLILKEEEQEKYQDQLEKVLDSVAILGELKTEEVEPIYQVTDLENVTREDVTQKFSMPRENKFFKVKAIFPNEA